MSKASKLARAQKNVPAVSQKILTKANRFYNGGDASIQSTNTHGHVEGTYNSNTDHAFFLLEEAIDGYTDTSTPSAGEQMFIDDLQLSYHTSYVRLNVTFNGDTNDDVAANVLKVQRSTSGASEYATTGWDDIHVAAAYPSPDTFPTNPRIQASSSTGYAANGRSIENGTIRVIDKIPGTLTPHYRVLLHVKPGGSYSYLNRDRELDKAGSGIGTETSNQSVPRTISSFTAEEIINY